MGKKAFIDKKTAKHFQLVHRSQRDPNLVNSDETKYVLKPTLGSANLLRHGILPPEPEDYFQDEEYSDEFEEEEPKQRDLLQYKSELDVGKAVQYGIYFEDQEEYDYMKHLKPIGEHRDAVFVASKDGKTPAAKGLEFKDPDVSLAESKVKFTLPSGIIASTRDEEDVGLLARESTQPIDVDPKYREAIYALDDEAYLEESLSEDFLDALDAAEVPETYRKQVEQGEQEWEQFMGTKFDDNDDGSEDEYASDYGSDYSDAPRTNFSMTSSAMFRNENLTLLDDRFDQVLAEYDSDDSSGSDSVPDLLAINHDITSERKVDPSVPKLENGRFVNADQFSEDRLSNLMDDFLTKKAILGKNVVSRQNMVIGHDDFENYRRELLAGSTKAQVVAKGELLHEEIENDDLADLENHPFFAGRKSQSEEEKWDCETIISTYSNVYNRPTIIDDVATSKKKSLKKKRTSKR